MSAWRNLLAEMAEHGGSDIYITRLPGRCRDNSTQAAREYLVEKGFIVRCKSHCHSLTEAGWLQFRGVVDMYPHKGQRGINRHELHLAIRDTVPDVVIAHVLQECGYTPGAQMTPEILRGFANRIASEARATA